MARGRLQKTTVQSNFTSRDFYDLVIVGTGIAGLTTGLLWQKNRPGDSVLIIEKEPFVGGYVTAYRQG
ncbi:MAG: NAD(P)-binding protein [Spirochaetaceae bacterium]|nr:NAD(P)-binding protein [Spirochaetaceae bacterium]